MAAPDWLAPGFTTSLLYVTFLVAPEAILPQRLGET